ncbi:conjugal transfer protein [Streptomyces sp. NPDC091027]|uniref:conjugal transfer protein n=1 Tax=Streptomyces sp. NPDC091027 TaxID=3365971 RepID=UPI0037F6D5D7
MELWLRGDSSVSDSGIESAMRVVAPGVELPKRPRSAGGPAAAAPRVVAVRTSVGPDAWTVVVAAVRDQPGAAAGDRNAAAPPVRYYAVSGSGGRNGTPVTIGGAPAEVAAPDAAPVPGTQFSHRVPAGGMLERSLGEFVRAYLGGGPGEALERYLTPGLRISAPKAAPYVRIEVAEVVTDTEAATTATVPADGTKGRVRIRVTGEDKDGIRWPLVYRAEVTARAGRWEVSTLESGITDLPAGVSSSSPTSVAGGAR